MIQDFESSGLVDLAAKTYRVIAFDRPGFGYGERPRSTVWTQLHRPTLSTLLLYRWASLNRSYWDTLGERWLQ
jgi:pimeloyl-ACP methyl ester carboxylesterase